MTDPQLTFENMAKVYPELQNMLNEAGRVDGSDPHFCANKVWYSDFKPRLVRLVGFDAPRSAPDWITTHKAYELACRTIYDELPGCRNCTCL